MTQRQLKRRLNVARSNWAWHPWRRTQEYVSPEEQAFREHMERHTQSIIAKYAGYL